MYKNSHHRKDDVRENTIFLEYSNDMCSVMWAQNLIGSFYALAGSPFLSPYSYFESA